VALIGGGFWLYTRTLGDTAPADGPISAVPVAAGTGASGAGSLVLQIVPEKSEVRFTISNVPFVANVGEQVKLDIDFVAETIQSQ
jgi:hypothetical protein